MSSRLAHATSDPVPSATPAEVPAGLTPPPPVTRGRSLRETIGELGLADDGAVAEAVAEAHEHGAALETVLVERGVLDASALERVVAAREGLPHLDLAAFAVEPEAVALLSPHDARHLAAQPVAVLASGSVLVAMADPRDEQALSDLTLLLEHPVERAVVGRDPLEALVASRLDVADPPAPVEPAAPPVPSPAGSALDQLQAALRSVEAEVEQRLRAELEGSAAAARAELEAATATLGAELEAERVAHAETRRELGAAQADAAAAERRVEAVRAVLDAD